MASSTILIIFLLFGVSAIFTNAYLLALDQNAKMKKSGQLPDIPALVIAGLKFLAMAPVATTGLLLAIHYSSPYAWLIVAGLAVCLAADMAIMANFIAGLAVFLTGHAVYIFAFNAGKHSFMGPDPAPLMLYAVIGAIVYLLLWPRLNTMMKFAVAAYVITIVIMAWQALVRFQCFGNPLMLLAVVGAILFMASDSVLAMKTFQPQHRISAWLKLERTGEPILMGTYIAAQWLICLSILA